LIALGKFSTYFCLVLLLLDNYDSFTYNLYDYLTQSGADVEVIRNDKLDISSIGEKYSGIILSPGPGEPKDAGCTLEVIHQFHKTLPILGICLGMQAIGQYFGASLVRANFPMHGKTSTLNFDNNQPIFKDIQSPLEVCRYHSLLLTNTSNTPLEVIATTPQNEPMAIIHKDLPITGLQFHPEAILTKHGLKIISNWLTCHSLMNNKQHSQ